MGTYKKHGNKPKKSRSEKIEEKSSIAKFFSKLDYGATIAQDWVLRHRVPILVVIGVIVVGSLGYLAYDSFVMQPREQEAVKEMSQPLDYFTQGLQTEPGAQQDTLFMKSLNGAGGYGLLDIIDDFNGTDAANLAEYSAGMSYLKLGKYENAIEHLEKFEGDDEFYPAIAKGAIGDAYREDGNPKEALKYYEKAANSRDNSYITPKYLLKAAITALDLDKFNEAKKFLKKIEQDYPESVEADRVAVYKGLAEKGSN